MEYIIKHHPERKRFETTCDGYTAYIEYVEVRKGLDLVHTIVPPPIGGRGVAAALVKYVLEYAGAHNLFIVPSCSYVDAYIRKHPEYDSLVL